MTWQHTFTVVRRATMYRLGCLALLATMAAAAPAQAYDGPDPVTYNATLNGIKVVMTIQGKMLPVGLTYFNSMVYVPVTTANVGYDVIIQLKKFSPAGSSSDIVIIECTFTPEEWDVGKTVAYPCSEFVQVPYSAAEGSTLGFFPLVRRLSSSGTTTHNGRTGRVNATVVTDDAKEQNNTFESATDLGTLAAPAAAPTVTVSDLVLNDPDFFKFTTPSNPSLGSATVIVENWDYAGIARTYLMDQDGGLLAELDGMADGQRATIAIEPNTTYYVRVTSPYGDKFLYDLTVTLGPPDALSITSGPSGTPNPVDANSTAQVSVRATDALAHPLTYRWQSICGGRSGGTFSRPYSTTSNWTPPQGFTGPCTISVTISDGQGLTVVGDYTQTVTGTPLHTITFTTPATGAPGVVVSGQSVQLNAAARDSLGHVLSYAWQASCPGLTSNGTFSPSAMERNPTWTAPKNATGSERSCTLVVTADDNAGKTATSSVAQQVATLVDEITFTSPATGTPDPVASGGNVNLSVTAADSFDHTVSYAWSATCDELPTSGTFVPNTVVEAPRWIAPENTTEQTQTCRMAVTAVDGNGITATSSYVQHVNPVPPIICSGFSKTAPKNLAINQATSLTLTWTSAGAGCSYEYCLDKETRINLACDSGWVPAGTNTSAMVSSLAFSSSHYWQVRASNGAATPKYTYANGTSSLNTGTWWRFTTARMPMLTITAATLPIDEAAGGGVFTIKRTGDTSKDLTVPLTLGGSALPNEDFTIDQVTQDSQTQRYYVTMAAGQLQTTVAVTGVGDPLCEGDETITLTLLPNENYVLGTSKTATLTIADDDVSLAGADLTVTSLSSTTAPGSSLTIKYTVRNDAGTAADPSLLTFYLSTDATLSAGDREFATRPVKALAAFGSDSGTFSAMPPDDLPPGQYYLLAKADADLMVCESQESNNTRSRVTYLGPDLVVSLPWTSGSVPVGGTVSFTIQVKNSGSDDAAPSKAKVYLSQTYGGGAANDVLLTEIDVPVLAPTQSWQPQTVTIPIPPTIEPGYWYLIAVADAGQAVLESRETNNQRNVSIEIY